MFDKVLKPRAHKADAVLSALKKSIAIIEFEPDGTIITANDAFLDAMGYKLSEVQGKNHNIFVKLEDREGESYKAFWQALRKGEFQGGAFRRIGKGERAVWIQGTYCPVEDTSGAIVKVIKVADDITKRHTTSLRMDSIFASVDRSQAVIEFDIDGTIQDANENFLSAMKYSLEEIRGKHHSIFVDPDYAASEGYSAFWQALKNGE